MAEQSKPKKNKKKIIIIVAIVVALICIAVVLMTSKWGRDVTSSISDKIGSITGKADDGESGGEVDGVKITKMSQEELAVETQSLLSQGKTEAAQKMIEYQDYHNDGSFATILYAQVLEKNGDIESALRVLSEAEAANERKYWYRGHAANILYAAERYTEAVEVYRQAIDLALSYDAKGDEDAQYLANDAAADYQWYIDLIESDNER